MSSPLIETERLVLRELTESDAEFYFAILTDPDFKRFIADRGIRDANDALVNLRDRVLASYDAHGFGMWLVSRRVDGRPVGMAGLVKREFLNDVDLGYAFLPEGRGSGFATESAAAVMGYALERFGLQRLAAIVAPDNLASIRVLDRLGFRHTGQVRFPDGGDVCEHFLCELVSGRSRGTA
jgi:RimJ/RimL family protein N-acetyltransferase